MFAALAALIAQKFGLSPAAAETVVRSVLGLLDSAPDGIAGIATRLKALGLSGPAESWIKPDAPVIAAAQAGAVAGEQRLAALAQELHVPADAAAAAFGFTLPKVLGLLADHGTLPATLPPAAQTVLKGVQLPAGLPADHLLSSRIGDWALRGAILVAALGFLWWLTPRIELGKPMGGQQVAAPTAPAAPAAAGQGGPAGSQGPARAGSHGAAPAAPAPASSSASHAPAAGTGHAPAAAPAATAHSAPAAGSAPAAATPTATAAAPATPSAPGSAPAAHAPAPQAPAAQASATPTPASPVPAPGSAVAPAPSTRLSLREIAGTIFYLGTVPDASTAESIRAALVGVFGPDAVKGSVAVDPQAAAPSWLARLGDLIALLKGHGANAVLDGNGLTFKAIAPGLDRAALEAAIGPLLKGGKIVFPDAGTPRLSAADAQSALDGLKGGYAGTDVARTLNLVAIGFDTGSADIPAAERTVLVRAATLIKALPSGARVVIEGYTDNVGEPDSNLALSQRRADAVKVILVEAGLAVADIEAIGYGEANPVADNATPEGRAQNRRISYEVFPR